MRDRIEQCGPRLRRGVLAMTMALLGLLVTTSPAQAVAPTALTQGVSFLTDSSVTLNGALNPGDAETLYYFDYGTTTSLGTPVPLPVRKVPGDGVNREVQVPVTGLASGTQYYYRLVVSSDGCGGPCGPIVGATQSFVTTGAALPPTATTGDADPIGAETARLNATVDTKGLPATYRFEWGPTAALGNATPATTLAAGFGDQPATDDLTGLNQLTTYHYRVVATTAHGTVRGATRSFDTRIAPIVVAPPPPVPVLTIDSPKAPEGGTTTNREGVVRRNVGQLVFTLRLNVPSPDPLVVKVRASSTTATARPAGMSSNDLGYDYVPVTCCNEVTFAPGQTSAVFPVTVMGDNGQEPDETIELAADPAFGPVTIAGTGTGTVLNDDGGRSPAFPPLSQAAPAVSVDDAAAFEDSLGAGPVMHVPVRLSFASAVPRSYALSFKDGTALRASQVTGANADYAVTEGVVSPQIVFEPGETVKTVPVYPQVDRNVEPDETFTFTAGPASATATILNDDPKVDPAEVARAERERQQLITSLYQGAGATGYEFDTDGNGTWETKCALATAVARFPSAPSVSPELTAILRTLGIPVPAALRQAVAGAPATYTFAARAVTTDDDGTVVQLAPPNRMTVPVGTVNVDKAFLLEELRAARGRLNARLTELRRSSRKTGKARAAATTAQQAAVQAQITAILRAANLLDKPGALSGPLPKTVLDAITTALTQQANTPIKTTCGEKSKVTTGPNAGADKDCFTSLVYKFVEMAFPKDAPAGSCFKRVAASGPTGVKLGTGEQYRSNMSVPILVNGLRLQNGSLPLVDEKVDEKISHVRFVLDTGTDLLSSVSDTTGFPPFAGIYGELKPNEPSVANRYILQTDLVSWPVDRASKVTDAAALKRAIAGLPTNQQKIGFGTKYGSKASAALSLGGLALNGIDEVHLLRKRSAAFGSFLLPTLVRPTDAELADPTRKKSALELLQGVTVQTTFSLDNTAGFVFDGLNAKVAEIPAGNLFKIKDLSLSYVRGSDEWRGSMEMLLPPAGAYGAQGSFTIRGGKFVGLKFAALFNPGVQLGCCVRLTKIGGSYENTFWDADGCLTSPATCSSFKSSHADQLPTDNCRSTPTIAACEKGVQLAGLFGLAAGPRVVVSGESRDLLTVDGAVRFVDSTPRNPWALTASADFKLLNDLTFGHAVVTYINGRQFSAYGSVERTFAAGCLTLVVNGNVGLDVYSATRWQAFAGFGLTGELCGVGKASFAGELLGSTRGVAACARYSVLGIDFSSGVVYVWANQKLSTFSGCSHDKLVAEGGVTARAAVDPGETRTIDVAAGLPSFLFKATGAAGSPGVVLTGPGGQTVDTTGAAVRGFSFYPGVDGETYIDVHEPQAGTWTITPKPGSAITKLETANGIPEPKVAATVGGAGRSRALRYTIATIPGQTVRFAERLPGKAGVPGPARLLGTSSSARGTLRFAPVDGPRGRRTIEATVLQDGEPRKVLTVAGYTAPGAFRPARPAVRLRRKGTRLVVSWPAVRGARTYRVLVRVTALDRHTGRLVGRTRYVTRTAGQRTVTVPGVSSRERVGVSVTAVSSSGVLGPTGYASRGG